MERDWLSASRRLLYRLLGRLFGPAVWAGRAWGALYGLPFFRAPPMGARPLSFPRHLPAPQTDFEKQLARLERDTAQQRSDHAAAVAAVERSRQETSAALEACERSKAAAVQDCERLRLEVASVREDLAGARSSGSSGSEQLRVRTEELMRCEAARATAEALCAELRSGLAEAKVRRQCTAGCGVRAWHSCENWWRVNVGAFSLILKRTGTSCRLCARA